MCGNCPRRHPDRKTPTEYFYYACQYNPKTASHVAAAPDHPRTVQVREDLLHGRDAARAGRLRAGPRPRTSASPSSSPPPPTAKKEQHDRQAAALQQAAQAHHHARRTT